MHFFYYLYTTVIYYQLQGFLKLLLFFDFKLYNSIDNIITILFFYHKNMKQIHFTIKFNFLLVFSVIILAVISISLIGVAFFLYSPLDLLKLKIKIDQQSFNAKVVGAIPIHTEVKENIKVKIDETFKINFPFNQDLEVPVNETFSVPVEIETQMPIRLTVYLDADIPIETVINIDNTFSVRLFGMNLSVPVKGLVPLSMSVPVKKAIPINEIINIKFKSPTKVHVNSMFHIPIRTKISADIPIKHQLNVPIAFNLDTKASLKGDLPDLQLLENWLDVGLEQFGFEWKDKIYWMGKEKK